MSIRYNKITHPDVKRRKEVFYNAYIIETPRKGITVCYLNNFEENVSILDNFAGAFPGTIKAFPNIMNDLDTYTACYGAVILCCFPYKEASLEIRQDKALIDIDIAKARTREEPRLMVNALLYALKESCEFTDLFQPLIEISKTYEERKEDPRVLADLSLTAKDHDRTVFMIQNMIWQGGIHEVHDETPLPPEAE